MTQLDLEIDMTFNKQRTKKDQNFLTQKFIVPLTTEDLMIRHKFVTSLDLHVDF